MCYVNHQVYKAYMSSTHNGNTVLQHFERSNAMEICNKIKFDFYPGVPHTYRCLQWIIFLSQLWLQNRTMSTGATTKRPMTHPNHAHLVATVSISGQQTSFQNSSCLHCPQPKSESSFYSYNQGRNWTTKALIQPSQAKHVILQVPFKAHRVSFLCIAQSNVTMQNAIQVLKGFNLSHAVRSAT